MLTHNEKAIFDAVQFRAMKLTAEKAKYPGRFGAPAELIGAEEEAVKMMSSLTFNTSPENFSRAEQWLLNLK